MVDVLQPARVALRRELKQSHLKGHNMIKAEMTRQGKTISDAEKETTADDNSGGGGN